LISRRDVFRVRRAPRLLHVDEERRATVSELVGDRSFAAYITPSKPATRMSRA
jgi:hypothetical protein